MRKYRITKLFVWMDSRYMTQPGLISFSAWFSLTRCISNRAYFLFSMILFGLMHIYWAVQWPDKDLWAGWFSWRKSSLLYIVAMRIFSIGQLYEISWCFPGWIFLCLDSIYAWLNSLAWNLDLRCNFFPWCIRAGTFMTGSEHKEEFCLDEHNDGLGSIVLDF